MGSFNELNILFVVPVDVIEFLPFAMLRVTAFIVVVLDVVMEFIPASLFRLSRFFFNIEYKWAAGANSFAKAVSFGCMAGKLSLDRCI